MKNVNKTEDNFEKVFKNKWGGNMTDETENEILNFIRSEKKKSYFLGREKGIPVNYEIGFKDGYESTNPSINGYEITKKHMEQTFLSKKGEIIAQALDKRNKELVEWTKNPRVHNYTDYIKIDDLLNYLTK